MLFAFSFSLCELSWMSTRKLRNLSYKKVIMKESSFFVVCVIGIAENLLRVNISIILYYFFFYLGCEETKVAGTEYPVCPGDWKILKLNSGVPWIHWQEVDSLYCWQGGCSSNASGSPGKYIKLEISIVFTFIVLMFLLQWDIVDIHTYVLFN